MGNSNHASDAECLTLHRHLKVGCACGLPYCLVKLQAKFIHHSVIYVCIFNKNVLLIRARNGYLGTWVATRYLGTRSIYYRVAVYSAVPLVFGAMLKQTKQHSGYNACERCVQKGDWVGRVIYPETDAPKRTDVAFDEITDESHHRGPSPLQGLGFGLVTSFCLDYMHLVCMGVMRKLLTMWMRGPLSCRLSSTILHQISLSAAFC